MYRVAQQSTTRYPGRFLACMDQGRYDVGTREILSVRWLPNKQATNLVQFFLVGLSTVEHGETGEGYAIAIGRAAGQGLSTPGYNMDFRAVAVGGWIWSAATLHRYISHTCMYTTRGLSQWARSCFPKAACATMSLRYRYTCRHPCLYPQPFSLWGA